MLCYCTFVSTLQSRLSPSSNFIGPLITNRCPELSICSANVIGTRDSYGTMT